MNGLYELNKVDYVELIPIEVENNPFDNKNASSFQFNWSYTIVNDFSFHLHEINNIWKTAHMELNFHFNNYFMFSTYH